MQPGTRLRRMARLTCSSDHCDRVLEPALADLQHEWSASNNWWALLRSYAAFWRSWGVCVLQDATALESRSFGGAALGAFALTFAGMALIEFVFMHGNFATRRLILSIPSRLVSAAMFDTATLRYGVPLAMGPAVLYATSRSTRVAPAAYLIPAALGMFLTVLSSGWIAPTLIRHDMTRQYEGYARWAVHAPSSSVRGWYTPPLDFSSFQPAKSWPELIRSAVEPPRHQSALMPWYVAPGEENRPAADRHEIIERVFLVLLAFGSAVVGGTIGRLTGQPVGCRYE
jgi:hypothetical protein